MIPTSYLQNVNHSRFRSVGEIIYLSQNVPFNSNYVRQTVGNFAREMGQYNTTTGACSGNPSDCGRYAQVSKTGSEATSNFVHCLHTTQKMCFIVFL